MVISYYFWDSQEPFEPPEFALVEKEANYATGLTSLIEMHFPVAFSE